MSRMPSVMSHDFSRTATADIQRSSFDRSHGLKTTFDAGYLIPILADEVLPGDTFNLDMAGFGRLATPLHPFMDNVFLDTFFFAVPIRLLWSNWEKFNGEQTNPGDSTDYLVPQVTTPVGGFASESIYDYFGLPPLIQYSDINALHLRAYNLIYNEWFRDENLQNSVTVNTGDGPDTDTDYSLLRRGKRHDYFTSCLPWPQKGDAVALPLGTSADVQVDVGSGNILTVYDTVASVYRQMGAGGTYVTNAGVTGSSVNKLYADLTNATASTINDLREAFQIQKLYERDARGGTRYTEIISSHFGVNSPDARMQRPEYLGGGSSPLMINPVEQTSSTDVTSPQGNLAGVGTLGFRGHGFSKSFTEHCVIVGLCNVRADLNYQQGINKMWTRQTRWDYFWPALQNIGEQAVLSREIYADGTANDDNVFGYQERYAEYRYKPSQVTAQFRSSYPTPLDSWHLAQDFASRPVLGATFIEDNPPIDRVIAVPSEPHFLLDCYFSYKCARPMPTYAVPGMIDHF